ncbi:MAG: DrmE family protein [Candidatus Bathyarchaeota archaeon]|nr:DrmE family protein [Candidatus Bathyarchaeota archaeon]
MDDDLIQKLKYSFIGQNEAFSLPLSLIDSLKLISRFFACNTKNKLCLVFPSKENVAQWLTLPYVLFQIESDYKQFKNEIAEALETYKKGDWIILNNDAVVEWIGKKHEGFVFRHKEYNEVDTITVDIKNISKIQPAPPNRKALSSYKRVIEALNNTNRKPIDEILGIKSYDNKLFQKNSICLVSKIISFENSISNISLNGSYIEEYFKYSKIDESGEVDFTNTLLISSNLSNLSLYLTHSKTISKIIIDGFNSIYERGTDFSDIDAKNIHTILITDLSEIEKFESIGKFGFEFFNFTKEKLHLEQITKLSPFYSFEKKIDKYLAFNVVKEICIDEDLEAITQKIHSIEKDDSNSDLSILKVSLIQITNHISRISHILSEVEISVLKDKINKIESSFYDCRIWLGDSQNLIEESISLLKSVAERFAVSPSEKCIRLKTLLNSKHYEYIICSTEEEAKTLASSFTDNSCKPKIISVADVNDKLLSGRPQIALLTGWPKYTNVNRIISSFLFSELTVLFYQFENKYYNSLQRRNRRYCENIKTTININGIRSEPGSKTRNGFDDLYNGDEVVKAGYEISFDVSDFELKLDSALYSKYSAKGSLLDSIKAKRIVFEGAFFIYSTESHRFLVINELLEKQGKKADISRRKVESLKPGDIIAFISTDRDILVELVEKSTNRQNLAAVKKWTDLWKNLLKEYVAREENDFKKLVDELRNNDCKKHEVTIRTWLQDENRIGPNDDSDLISIAIVTNSQELLDNISKVRDSIRKMVGWRMKASDYISNQIKSQIHNIIDESLINSKVEIEGLGSVTILKVGSISNNWEEIDIRFVNRLIEKETI